MTPFGQLELTKQAGKYDLLMKGVKSLYRNGAWPTLSRVAQRGHALPGTMGLLSRGTSRVANVMTGPLETGLGLYGATALAAPLTGVNLPGSTLALNLGMPILGGMDTAANLISSMRAKSPAMQEKIRGDVEAGARGAARDAITGMTINPYSVTSSDAYRRFMEDQGINMRAADEAAHAPKNKYGFFGTIQSVLSDPQKLIEDEVARKGYEQINKQAAVGRLVSQLSSHLGPTVGSWGKRLGAFSHHVFTPAAVAGSVYGLGNAAFSDKPYDAEAVQQQGYNIGQAAIQKRLQRMNALERLGLKIDPSLFAGGLEKEMPGIIGDWENRTGAKHAPGLISSTVDAWKTGGKPKFFWTDTTGTPRYIN